MRLSGIVTLNNVKDGTLIADLKRDLHLYIAAARGFSVDHSDVDVFTDSVLLWWRNHGASTGSWAFASLLVISFIPSSASSERVFSLIKCLFGDNQDASLADIVQSAVMLRYNKRDV